MAHKHFNRDDILDGTTYKIKPVTLDVAVYITINNAMVGGQFRPVEIFINSKDMPSLPWVSCVSRLLSACMQQDAEFPEFIIGELKNTFDVDGGYIIPKSQGKSVNGVAAHIGLVLEEHWEGLKAAHKPNL